MSTSKCLAGSWNFLGIIRIFNEFLYNSVQFSRILHMFTVFFQQQSTKQVKHGLHCMGDNDYSLIYKNIYSCTKNVERMLPLVTINFRIFLFQLLHFITGSLLFTVDICTWLLRCSCSFKKYLYSAQNMASDPNLRQLKIKTNVVKR